MAKNKGEVEKKITFDLKLYVVYSSKSSYQATVYLKAFLDKKYPGQYKLEIIDVMQNPELAKEDNIFATPTVIKKTPLPVKKLFGNFGDENKLIMGLGILNN